MSEPTQADEELAYEFTKTGYMKGSAGIHILAEIASRHRLAARKQALEDAAQVANEYASKVEYDGASLAAVQLHAVPKAIRAMIEEK